MPPPPASGDLNSHPELSAWRLLRMSTWDFVLYPLTKFVVRRPSRFEDMADFRSRTWHLSVWWPWPLTFWPWNWCAMLPVARTNFLPMLVLVRLFVELWANMHQTDDVTLWPWTLTFEVTANVGDAGHHTVVLHPYTKFEVRSPSSSEDISDFRHGVKRPGDLDLSTSKWGHDHPCHGFPYCQFSAC